MKLRFMWPLVWHTAGLGWLVSIPLLIGNLNFKHRRNELFSERNGYKPVLRLGLVSLIWVRYR